MEFFRFKRDIPFMKYALIFNAISLFTFLVAVGALGYKGLHFGIDFTGGTVAELRYAKPADIAQARTAIETLKTGEATVQNFGSVQDVLVRLPLVPNVTNAQMSENLFKAVCGARTMSDTKTACGDGAEKIELKRVEFVGPQVGKELFESGALAMLLVIAGIMIYLAIRFEWRFAVAAIIANLHDIIIILGLFAIFGWEFNLPVLAGILAILGYSVNESVVVADRVRENFRKMRKASVDDVIDNAITSTISRTIITHGSTQIMVLSMLFFGGETLHYFALALTIGICFGIYSSVLVMAPLVRWLGVSRENLVKAEGKPKDALEAEKILP
ncbi:MAG: protein translocase subunit SecF [Casimicrobium sp.]